MEKYVQFLESAEKVQGDLEQLENLLRGAPSEDCGPVIEETWGRIKGMIHDLTDMGNAFVKSAQKVLLTSLSPGDQNIRNFVDFQIANQVMG